MPKAPPKPCAHPGCPELVRGRTRCPQHERVQHRRDQRERGTAAQRGYDARWRRIRNRKMRTDPLCECCKDEGRTKPAQMVHHHVPLAEGGTHRPDNLVSICYACHEREHDRTAAS